jgi:8-oxo-dGTP diphosphatase
MTNYVAGFCFNADMSKVALIEKQKPEWQKGFFNGIGGKVEPGELPYQAMKREFFEEAGIMVDRWRHLAKIGDDNYTVVFFYGVIPDFTFFEIKSMEDERVVVCDTDRLPSKIIPNLAWLIPLALDKAKNYSGKISLFIPNIEI